MEMPLQRAGGLQGILWVGRGNAHLLDGRLAMPFDLSLAFLETGCEIK